ncbi:MAG: carbon starvation CstA 5TM domain-containing protein, partial [Olegusella sp.]|nr:carbon starvation CstA 5TM domain-containing protein [Olegusella sp.]
VLGIFVMGAHGEAAMTAPAFVGLTNAKGQFLFPVLFVSVACGALSGFHSLVSTNTSSKQVSNETDALPVGYGAMVLESFVGVIAIVIAGIVFADMNVGMTDAAGNALYSPFNIFAGGIAKGMTMMGFNTTVATVFMTMCISALALTSLDAVARIARLAFSEFFAKTNDAAATEATGAMKVLGNPWFATVVTLFFGLLLTFGGYLNIWPLFGASNQLLGGMTMITLAVFCKCTGRKGWMLYAPVAFLLLCTFTSLGMSIVSCYTALMAGGATAIMTAGLQLVFAVLLVVLGVIVAYSCLKEFFNKEAGSIPDEQPEWTEMGREHVAEREHATAAHNGAAQRA